MKVIYTFFFFLFIILSSTIFAADENCESYASNPDKACACLLNNAYAHAGGKYSKSFLDNAFKHYPSVALANCENTGGAPDHCQWGVDYYDNNAAPHDNPPVVKRSSQCPAPSI